jgi:LmbE family N-acetylglucosaminyl deacetylase
MLQLGLGVEPGRPLDLLFIGAHSDDIEIGCGGTVLRLLAEHPGSHVRWVVLSATAGREREARASAAEFLAMAGSVAVEVAAFRESYFPYVGAEVKDFFNGLGRRCRPDVVFCHTRADEHQDHRTVAELVWNTFRDHVVCEYEIPKYEGDLGRPNLYVTLTPDVVERKIELLMRHFGTQRSKRWFRTETFAAMMALRGIEAGATAAEAFHARKLVI